MAGKATQLIGVGGDRWVLDFEGLTEDQVSTIVLDIRNAVENGTFIEIKVLDLNGRPKTLWLNGANVDYVEYDSGLCPRPSEIGR
ncbi:hypothetical protein Lesp02_02140 [Lentzea sp. NBRC 105346]|uniref:hypothetical protein n=1 Tax=Lentzea sp. NBRC 105346 TaxID=3032205 RepID=UPI0024A5B3AE|nr:hypothetical protein [Lentzea sp. NBRC 105346]GLZ28024.1 hypothetical protein Lesp02_02140 [Lentzea sp. NBRC 105346]